MALIGALDRTKHFSEFDEPLFEQGGTVLTGAQRKALALAALGVTATAAELALIADVTAGTGAVSKAVTLDASGVFTGPSISTAKFSWNVTSTSTSASVSVEPFSVTTSMTGIGGVGGRAAFRMNTEVVLGGWANALKAEVDFGDTGSVTGLGSALVAEMTLGLSMPAGTYAPLEIELNAPSGADLGTATSLIYASVNGDDADTVNNGASFLSLNGMVVDAAGMFATNGGAVDFDDVSHGLRISVNGDDYFLLAVTAALHAA